MSVFSNDHFDDINSSCKMPQPFANAGLRHLYIQQLDNVKKEESL